MYRTYEIGLNTPGFGQTEKINGAIPTTQSTRLVRKDPYAMKATRLLTGSMNAENIARILIGKSGNVAEAEKRITNIMDRMVNADFTHEVTANIWPSNTQRIHLTDESIETRVVTDAIREAGVTDISELHAISDVFCSMLARTTLIADSKPLSAIHIQDSREITIEDLELEAMMQAVQTAFESATYSITFDSSKTTPQIIAMRLAEKCLEIYDNLRWVSSAIGEFRDAVAIARQSEEQYADNGAILDKSILQDPALLMIMKDITLSRIIREQKVTPPTCNVSFYSSRLRKFENMLKKSQRFEFVQPKRSVAHISVDRLTNARGLVTDVIISSHAVPTQEVVVCHHIPRSNDGRIQSLKTEIEDTQTLQYYLKHAMAHDLGMRTARGAATLLSANSIYQETAEEVTVHLLGNVSNDDLVTLAVMNSTNIYLEGVKDADNFKPTLIFYKMLGDNSDLKPCASQPAGQVISTNTPLVMAAYSAPQEVVEPLNFTHEGFMKEVSNANILGNLKDYSHDDLNRVQGISVTDTNGKTHKAQLKYYGMITNKIPHNQVLLASPYAEIHFPAYLNALKGVYDHVAKNFDDRGRTRLDNQFARLVYEYIEPMMTDPGTYNLARAVGHDMMSKVTDRSERASFFHQMYEGDYYSQIAFSICKFLLVRSHRIDSNTVKWMTKLFEDTNYWIYYSQSIIRQARGTSAE